MHLHLNTIDSIRPDNPVRDSNNRICITFFVILSCVIWFFQAQLNEFALINEMNPLQKAALQEHCTFATQFSLNASTDNGEGAAILSTHPKILMVLPLSVEGSLESHLLNPDKRNRPIVKSTLLTLLGDVAIALVHMHAMQLLHRDVAARNVLLNLEHAPDSSPRLRARLCDFGLSALVHANFRPHIFPQTWAPEAIVNKQVTREILMRVCDHFVLQS
jgi:serine/threonine protein kinase